MKPLNLELAKSDLQLAIESNSLEKVRQLIAAGANIEEELQEKKGKLKPIHYAAMHSYDAMRLLCEGGADVNSKIFYHYDGREIVQNVLDIVVRKAIDHEHSNQHEFNQDKEALIFLLGSGCKTEVIKRQLREDAPESFKDIFEIYEKFCYKIKKAETAVNIAKIMDIVGLRAAASMCEKPVTDENFKQDMLQFSELKSRDDNFLRIAVCALVLKAIGVDSQKVKEVVRLQCKASGIEAAADDICNKVNDDLKVTNCEKGLLLLDSVKSEKVRDFIKLHSFARQQTQKSMASSSAQNPSSSQFYSVRLPQGR